MAKIKNNCQDNFLQQVRREKVGVIIYLVNGFQLKGIVRGYDNFTLFLENEGKIQMVYKHAITTISPMKPIKIAFSPVQDIQEMSDKKIVSENEDNEE
ncbi:MAG TPA: RNA chaperone Hfq [Candidatus Eremiobacteraeota bacterium]|nr:MAG: RNA-binding protein Hfq [bacterium ADurb.Bin363]HPZ10312.1 RNA chaperone Hfq [Candidatus Eremiobacteraeota bacterium]